MSASIDQTNAPAHSIMSKINYNSARLISRIWPWAMITLGLGLTTVWIFFLGYELAKLIEMAI